MKKLLAITLVALLFGVAIYGFTSRDQDSPLQTEDDTLRLRLESFNLSLDPSAILDTQSRRVIDMLHARLLLQDAQGGFAPELADRWEWTQPLTLTLTLKTGRHFADGRPVRAADAAWSICRHLQPAAAFTWLFRNIEHRVVDDKRTECTGIRVQDDATLSIQVSHSPTRLLGALASSMGAVVPEDSTPGEYGSIVGAGPFRIDRVEANSAVHLSAVAGGPVTPGVDNVVLRHIPDDATAAAQFEAGQLDVLEIGNPRLLQMTEHLRQKAGIRIASADTHQVRVLIVNLERIQAARGWSAPETRGFLSALRDATAQVNFEAVFGVLGRTVGSNYFPARSLPASPVLGDTMPVGNPGSLQMFTENDPYSEQIAAALPTHVNQLAISYLGLDKSLLLNRLLQKDYDIASISLEALVADPAYWASFFTPGSPFTLFGTPIPDLMGVEANEDNTPVIGKIIDQQGNWVLLFQEHRQYLIQPGVRDERLLATGLIDYSAMTKGRRTTGE